MGKSRGFSVLLILVVVAVASLTIALSFRKKSQLEPINNGSENDVATEPAVEEKPKDRRIPVGYGWYTIENNIVYYESGQKSTPVEGADAATFDYVEDNCTYQFQGFYKDKNYVYFAKGYNGGTGIKNSDPSTFTCTGNGWHKDSNLLYYNSKTMGGDVIYTIDIDSVNNITAISQCYAKDENNVYFGNWAGLRTLKNADPDTIEVLNDCAYAKDKERVYYEDMQINKADTKTFMLIDERYSKDKQNVFYCNWGKPAECFIVEGADPRTMSLMKYEDEHKGEIVLVKDKNRLYDSGHPLADSDPETFTVIEDDDIGASAKDKNNYYKITREMSSTSIEIIDNPE